MCFFHVTLKAVRIMKFRVEEIHSVEIVADHPILLWAIEYAGSLLSRSQRSTRDGRAAYELRRGKKFKRPLPEFGEAVMYMPAGKRKAKEKLEERYVSGIFLGLVERSKVPNLVDGTYALTTTVNPYIEPTTPVEAV